MSKTVKITFGQVWKLRAEITEIPYGFRLNEDDMILLLKVENHPDKYGTIYLEGINSHGVLNTKTIGKERFLQLFELVMDKHQ